MTTDWCVLNLGIRKVVADLSTVTSRYIIKKCSKEITTADLPNHQFILERVLRPAKLNFIGQVITIFDSSLVHDIVIGGSQKSFTARDILDSKSQPGL